MGVADDTSADTIVDPAPANAATAERRRGLIGSRIGRYEILRPLGAGGMGIVYLAHDPELDRRVAIKLLRPGRRGSRSRLLREGQAIAKLTHPNVIAVHDVGEHGEDLFIAMEYVRGETLGQWLDVARPWREVLDRFLAAGHGVAAAHRAGIVHRDFKPDNVLLGEDGRVVVSDFGLARADIVAEPVDGVAIDTGATRTDGVVGTPAYMSPEQLRGDPADARSDQFSYCVALWEGLHGVRPFESATSSPTDFEHLARAVLGGTIHPPPRERAAPGRILRALRRGLSIDPDARFPSIDALLAALRPPDRRPLVAGIAAGTVAVAIGLVAAARSEDTSRHAACDDAGARVGAAWNEDRKRTYLRAGGEHAEEDARWLDTTAARWTDAARAVCAKGAAPRAVACLDDALAALQAAPDRAHREGWPELIDPRGCLDPRPLDLREVRTQLGNLDPSGAIAPDGERLAFAAKTELAAVLDARGEIAGSELLAGVDRVHGWANGGLLAGAGEQILRIDATSGARTTLPWKGPLLALSGDATIAAREEPGAAIFLREDGRPIAKVTFDDNVRDVEIAPDGAQAALTVDDGEHGWTLIVVDLATGAERRTPLRVQGDAGGVIAIAWAAPRRLVLGGSNRIGDHEGLWLLELDEDGAIAGPPAMLIPPRLNTIMDLVAVRDRRALIIQVDVPKRALARRAGTLAPVPGLLDGMIVAADAATGRMILAADDVVRLIGADGAVLATIPPGGPLAIRDGVLWRARALEGDVVLTDPDGEMRRIDAAIVDELDRIRCGSGGGCFVSWYDGETLRHAVLDGDRVGPPVEIPIQERMLDLAPDRRRWLVGTDHAIAIYDAATKKMRTVHEDDACMIDDLAWSADGATYGFVTECPGQNRMISVAKPGERPEIVERTAAVITGFELLAGGDLLYSTIDYQSRLVVVDGLPIP